MFYVSICSDYNEFYFTTSKWQYGLDFIIVTRRRANPLRTANVCDSIHVATYS